MLKTKANRDLTVFWISQRISKKLWLRVSEHCEIPGSQKRRPYQAACYISAWYIRLVRLLGGLSHSLSLIDFSCPIMIYNLYINLLYKFTSVSQHKIIRLFYREINTFYSLLQSFETIFQKFSEILFKRKLLINVFHSIASLLSPLRYRSLWHFTDWIKSALGGPQGQMK